MTQQNEQGLGQMMAQQQQGQNPTMQDMQQVVMMLQQGKTPQELVALGIPEAIVAKAVQIMQQMQENERQSQQSGMQEGAGPEMQDEQGLGQMMAGGR